MLPPLSQPGPVDLDALNDYLLSDRSPPDCMDVSQLDGFLAGVVIGPEMIMPSEFLPVIWGGEQPDFADAAEAEAILGSILGRYNEIGESLDACHRACAGVLGRPPRQQHHRGLGGRLHAGVALRSDAWEPALFDDRERDAADSDRHHRRTVGARDRPQRRDAVGRVSRSTSWSVRPSCCRVRARIAGILDGRAVRTRRIGAEPQAAALSRAASQREWNRGTGLSLRGAKRRSNPCADEHVSARQAGDCFVALLSQ